MNENKVDSTAAGQADMLPVTLSNDMGGSISFEGRLLSENSFFDQDSGMLTRQKLYLTKDGDQAYHIVSTVGDAKEKRAYLLRREGKNCIIFNGSSRMVLNTVDLLLVVKGLCGIKNADQARQFLEPLEDLVEPAANE